MKVNHLRFLTIALIAVCLLGCGFVGAVSAGDLHLKADPSTVNVGSSVTFTFDYDANCTYTASAIDGDDKAYELTTTEPESGRFTQTFSKAGTYEVTVTDTEHIENTGTATVTVKDLVTITSVALSLDAPVTGEPAKTSVDVSSYNGIESASVEWDKALDNGNYKAETEYTATIKLKTKNDYQFDSSISVVLNDVSVERTLSSDKKTLTFTQSFSKTATGTPTPIVYTFDANPKSGNAPLTVEFTYTIKDMNSGNIYLMNGDEKLAETTYSAGTDKISCTFKNDGTYNVILKAINGSKTGTSSPIQITVSADSEITVVDLKIAAPAIGGTPATKTDVTGTGVTCTNIEWATDPNIQNKLASGAKFAADTTYYADITLTNASGYHFTTAKPEVRVNGEKIDSSEIAISDPSGQTLHIVLKCFDKTSGTISSVSANVTAPATGNKPSSTATAGASSYKASSVTWYKDGSTTAINVSTDTFAADTKYTVTIVLEPTGTDSIFNSSLAKANALINGNAVSAFTRNSDTKVTMSYTFPATTKLAGPSITFTINPEKPKIPSNANTVTVTFSYTITGNPTSATLFCGEGAEIDLGKAGSDGKITGTKTHEFSSLGSFQAKITAKNTNDTSTATKDFSVGQDSLAAIIEASPASGTAPLKVTLKDASTGSVSSRIWDFGDGSTTSTDKTITHTYDKPGTYTVTLTVSDGKDTSKTIKAITVSEAKDENEDTGEKPDVVYEPFITIGDIGIPSPIDLIAEFVRLFQSMINFDNYHIFSNATESEEE